MIMRLPVDDKRDYRAELDADLGVSQWWPTRRGPLAAREDGAPAWWTGDEDASQAFLREYGARGRM